MWHRLLSVDAAVPPREYAAAVRRAISTANTDWGAISSRVGGDVDGFSAVLSPADMDRLVEFEDAVFAAARLDPPIDLVQRNRKRSADAAAGGGGDAPAALAHVEGGDGGDDGSGGGGDDDDDAMQVAVDGDAVRNPPPGKRRQRDQVPGAPICVRG
jgi:hypothetical protein